VVLGAGACTIAQEREMAALQDALASSGATRAAPGEPGAPGAQRPGPRPAPVHIATAGRPPPPPATTAELLGAGADAIRGRLCHPSLRRSEDTAEIWLRAGPSYGLGLALYPGRGGLRVAHAAARATGAEGRTGVQCPGELRAAGQGGAPATEGARPTMTPGGGGR
jgi:hypothetical protein